MRTTISLGLDVSVKETSVCIVDDVGKIVREVKVASGPGSVVGRAQEPCHYHFESESDWKPGRCRNGFTVHSLERS